MSFISSPPATPGGSTTQLQRNNAGAFAGSTSTDDGSTLKLIPGANSTSAVQILKADGSTKVLNVDSTNQQVGINAIPSSNLFQVFNTAGTQSRFGVDANGISAWANAGTAQLTLTPSTPKIESSSTWYLSSIGNQVILGRQGQYDVAVVSTHFDAPGAAELINFQVPALTHTIQGNIALQRTCNIGQVTYSAAGAQTVTTGASFNIAGPPIQGSNVTLTTPLALRIASGNCFYGGLATTYNNIATAGWGHPAIYAASSVTGQTARSAAVATYTVGASDGDFEVSGQVTVSASGTHSFSLDVVYTDAETNTSRTLTLPLAQLAGSFVASGLVTNVTGVGPYESAVMHIRAKASSSITIRPNAGTYTSVTYGASGVIKQMA